MFKEALVILQSVSAILLILVILSQQRGTGLSALFGGQGGVQVTKRGAEKVLAILTVVLAVIFVASSIAFLFVR